jgi:hypothetical protein
MRAEQDIAPRACISRADCKADRRLQPRSNRKPSTWRSRCVLKLAEADDPIHHLDLHSEASGELACRVGGYAPKRQVRSRLAAGEGWIRTFGSALRHQQRLVR